MAQRQRKGAAPTKGGSGMFYGVLAVIAIGGLAAIGWALTGGGAGEAATDRVPVEYADARDLYQQATPIRLGPDAAPIKVVEFADFQCPGCRAFSLQVRPRIMPFIERGQAQLVYYDFPLGGSHIHSFLAARAARCGGEQDLGSGTGSAYWTYHDKLYAEQSNWSAERDVVDEFVTYGEEIGLDGDALESCIRSDRYAEVVTANRLLGEELGVNSTPTVLVNNQRVGGRTIIDMGDSLVELLEQAVAEQAEGGAEQGG